MIPILYKADAVDFSTFGIGALSECTLCEVTEERNGAFECTLKYPVTGMLFSELKNERLIKAKPNDTSKEQLFRIYRITTPINGIVTIYAQHISYDLSNIAELMWSSALISPSLAMSRLFTKTATTHNFKTLKITPGTATSRNWSQITKYTAVCNGVTVSNTNGGVLNLGKISKSGNITVRVTVTDSRGYTRSVYKTITVIPYDRPNVYSITLRRTNEIESEMQLVFSGSISAITIDGTDKNSLKSVRYRYKKTNASSYGNFIDLLSSVDINGTSFSFSNLELCDFDVNSSYNFHLEIRDVFGSMTATDMYFTVPQGTPLIALRKKMVGINNPNPKAALDVTGEIYMNGFSVMGLQQSAIADDVSLNELTAPGIYFRRAVPQENLNYPALVFGMLEVFSCSVNLVIQRYTARDSPFDTFIRSRVNSSWSAWVKK